MESFDGSLRDEKAKGKDDDTFIALTPMSQPLGERPTFPPNARPIIYLHIMWRLSLDTINHKTKAIYTYFMRKDWDFFFII